MAHRDCPEPNVSAYNESRHVESSLSITFIPQQPLRYDAGLAGAVLVESYTGLAYAGPAFVPKAKQELADCLARDGFRTVQEAVGADHR